MRGFYCYLRAGVDPVATANAFCDLIGKLNPGEFAVLDHEEGNGTITSKGQRLLAELHEPGSQRHLDAIAAVMEKTAQETRAQAFLNTVDHRLGTKCWYYSYEAFVKAHVNIGVLGSRPLWMAAYRNSPPTVSWNLWQHTNAEGAAGIAKPCDCSIWPGDINSLVALVGGDDMQMSTSMKRGIMRLAGLAFLGRHWSEAEHEAHAADIADDGSNLEAVMQIIEDSPEGQAWDKRLDALRNNFQGAPGPVGPAGPAYDDTAVRADIAEIKAELQAIKGSIK